MKSKGVLRSDIFLVYLRKEILGGGVHILEWPCRSEGRTHLSISSIPSKSACVTNNFSGIMKKNSSNSSNLKLFDF